MSNKRKENDIVTEILDAAFDKPWAVYSLEEFKHQLAVLDDGTAGHECVKCRTNFCTNLFKSVMNSV